VAGFTRPVTILEKAKEIVSEKLVPENSSVDDTVHGRLKMIRRLSIEKLIPPAIAHNASDPGDFTPSGLPWLCIGNSIFSKTCCIHR